MKPCPFCGIVQRGEGQTFLQAQGVDPADERRYRPNYRACAAVYCWSCGAHGPTAGAKDLDAAKAAAVAKWDGRA